MKVVRTIEQRRAAFAMKRVKKDKEELQASYLSYANDLPAMIHMNGFGQAMAFIQSKRSSEPNYGYLYDLLADWLKKPGMPFDGSHDLLDSITDSSMEKYRLAQIESMALLTWVKKFAKVYMVKESVPEVSNVEEKE